MGNGSKTAIHCFIGFTYRNILKKVFFKLDPEYVHDRITTSGSLLGKFPPTRELVGLLFQAKSHKLTQTIAGLNFQNPVGLSAGFDKNAKLIQILPKVGFGFMEIGSVTRHAYEGNPKPRLFRLPKSKGLVVYYGLKNEGVEKITRTIKKNQTRENILGISVAKTNSASTNTEQTGINDYYDCLKYLESEKIGDYYTINISCPNTFGGEPFTTKVSLDNLLSKVAELKIKKPVFIKMPINLPREQFDELLGICIKHKVTGVVIGNLTKVRDSGLIKDHIPEHIQGGISGKPTEALCNQLISHTYQKYGSKLIIIGVGGIFSAADAYEKIRLGASLLQLITGMIFEGPQLVAEVNSGLIKLLEKDGYNNISEAIGTKHATA